MQIHCRSSADNTDGRSVYQDSEEMRFVMVGGGGGEAESHCIRSNINVHRTDWD